MTLSVIVPVFNEESSVVEVVERLLALPLPSQIIVVDDGSTDGTSQLLRRFPDHPNLTVHYSHPNRGKGAALRIGLGYARGEVVAIQDADLEYDPTQLLELVQPILQGRCEVVYGSRYLGSCGGMVWLQDLGNRVLTQFTNLLYGTRLTDAYTCHKVVSGPLARQLAVTLTSPGFEVEAEITARLLLQGKVPLELPIRYHARRREQGKKIRPGDGFKGLWTLWRMRWGF